MGEANADSHNIQQTSPEKPRYPKMWDALEKFRISYKKPTVEGRENMPTGPCVVAATHLSGFDVPEVAAEMMKNRKTGMSMQSSIYDHPLPKLLMQLMGKDNFFPLSNRNSSSLNDEDLKQMETAIVKDGRTIVVAAHNPTKEWKLPDNPGLSAVILAHAAKVPLVPVALDIQSRIPVREGIISIVKNALKHRPGSKIIIGNPMSLPEISDGKLEAAINLFSPDKRRAMTKEQIEEAQGVLDILKSEAGEVMKALASNLPPEKRGKWG